MTCSKPSIAAGKCVQSHASAERSCDYSAYVMQPLQLHKVAEEPGETNKEHCFGHDMEPVRGCVPKHSDSLSLQHSFP
jgi:hypothetical protein